MRDSVILMIDRLVQKSRIIGLSEQVTCRLFQLNEYNLYVLCVNCIRGVLRCFEVDDVSLGVE